MKKIALIFPRFRYPSGELPTGLATIAAFLREQFDDIAIDLIDTSFSPSFQYINKRLTRFGPDITGIFMDVLLTPNALTAAAMAKRLGSVVVAGGPHATTAAADIIRNDHIDAVCIGEGEITFKEYIDAFYRDKKFETVAGIWYKANGRVHQNPPRPVIPDIDVLPSPAYDLFNMERYIDNFFQLDSYRSDARGISLTVSRGCPFDCAFCQPVVRNTLGRKVRIRSPERVVDDIAYLQKTYAINALYFADDLITVVPGWMTRFSAELIDRNLQIAWGCNTRADTLDEATLQQMKAAGLVKIKIGIESVHDRIRNGIYHKNVLTGDIMTLLAAAEKLDIQVFGFFMLGAPTETAREVWDTIKFAARSRLTEALFSVTTPTPGSRLFDNLVAGGWIPPASLDDYDFNHVKRPKMSDHEISPGKLLILRKIAYIYFYLHPVRIGRTLRSFNTPVGIRKLLLKLKRI